MILCSKISFLTTEELYEKRYDTRLRGKRK